MQTGILLMRITARIKKLRPHAQARVVIAYEKDQMEADYIWKAAAVVCNDKGTVVGTLKESAALATLGVDIALQGLLTALGGE